MPVAPQRPPAADPAALPGSGARVVGHGGGSSTGPRNPGPATGTGASTTTSTSTADDAQEDRH